MAEYNSEKKETKSDGSVMSKQQRAIDLVKDCKDESITFYADKFAMFQYFDWLYDKGAAKRNVPRGRANLELPLAFQQVEPFVDQMMETVVGEAPWIAYQGRRIDDEQSAEGVTEYTQYQMEVGEFPVSLNPFLRNMGKYGTAVMKVIWEVDTIEVDTENEIPLPKINPDTGELEMDPITGMPVANSLLELGSEILVRHEGPKFYNISVYDFFVPKCATSNNVQKLPWCIHRTFRDIDALIENPNYINKKTLRAIRDGHAPSDIELDAEDPKREQLERDSDKGLEKFEDKVEVLEWWGDFKFNSEPDAIAEPAIIVLAVFDKHSPILLRLDKNPFKYKFKPFAAANDYPKEGEFYGYGELKHIKGLIEESTALRNARLDIANRSLNPMWLVERQSGINVRELYSAPDHVVLTNDNGGIKDLPMSGVTASSVTELSRIDFDIQNTTNIVNPRQDVSTVGPAFGSTATGVNFINNKSNLRMLSKARLFEQTFLKQLAMILLMYNKEMVTDTMWFRLMDTKDNPYRMIGPDAFVSQVDFKPTGNPEKVTREEKRQQIGYLMQTAAQVEGVAPGVTNFKLLLPEMYKASGFPHAERFVQDPTTTVMVGPDGQPRDKNGQPVQIVQVDEKGNPLPQAPMGANGPVQ